MRVGGGRSHTTNSRGRGRAKMAGKAAEWTLGSIRVSFFFSSSWYSPPTHLYHSYGAKELGQLVHRDVLRQLSDVDSILPSPLMHLSTWWAWGGGGGGRGWEREGGREGEWKSITLWCCAIIEYHNYDFLKYIPRHSRYVLALILKHGVTWTSIMVSMQEQPDQYY